MTLSPHGRGKVRGTPGLVPSALSNFTAQSPLLSCLFAERALFHRAEARGASSWAIAMKHVDGALPPDCQLCMACSGPQAARMLARTPVSSATRR